MQTTEALVRGSGGQTPPPSEAETLLAFGRSMELGSCKFACFLIFRYTENYRYLESA